MIYLYSAVDIKKEHQGVVATPQEKTPHSGNKKSEVIKNELNAIIRKTYKRPRT